MANPHETNVDKNIKDRSYESPELQGDFRIREISIHSPSNKHPIEINGTSMFIELSIYEDLFSNVLKGTYVFLDTQGYAEMIPLVGEETLILSYSTPAGEGTGNKELTNSQIKAEEAIRQRFKIYDCIQMGTQERAKIYKIYFTSEEYLFSSKTRISKGYKGKKYSFIVKDIMKKLNKNLRDDLSKEVFIEETATPQNVVIPNWNPLQAINFCASRSLSTDIEEQDVEGNNAAPANARPTGSLFVFYEKLGTGFFYESIESMILKQRRKPLPPPYQYSPKLAGGRSQNLSSTYFSVDTFEIKSSFKTLENLNGGMFGSKLIAYDPIRMKYDEVKFDYYEKDLSSNERTNDSTGMTEISEDVEQDDDSFRRHANFAATDIHPKDKLQNKFVSTHSDYVGANDANIKLATTTRSHDAMFVAPPAPAAPDFTERTSTIGVKNTTFKDQDAKPNAIEDWLLQRQAQIQEFGSIIVNFTVPGNTSRHVGDLVRFEVPTNIPEDTKDAAPVQVGHQLYSGLYLISKIKHIITKDDFKMDVELIKNSFAKRLNGQETILSTDGTPLLSRVAKERRRRNKVRGVRTDFGVQG